MKVHRRTRVLIAVACGVALASVGMSASAGEPGQAGPAEPRVDVVTQGELMAAAKSQSPEERQFEDEFIADQAAQGILLDGAQVDAAVVGDGSYAWSDNVEPREVQTASDIPDGAETARELGIISDHPDTLTTDSYAAMGSSPLTNLSGVANSWGGCVTASVGGNNLNSCWDLYRARENTFNPDRDFYYYGRHLIATGDQRDGAVDEYPMVIDARSRPTEGTAGRVATARAYYPFNGSSECSNTSIGVSIANFGATLPISNCSHVNVTPDGKAIKTEFSAGGCHDQRTEGLDLGITFAAYADMERPAYSDYSYARFSNNPAGPCDYDASNDIRVIFTDPGW